MAFPHKGSEPCRYFDCWATLADKEGKLHGCRIPSDCVFSRSVAFSKAPFIILNFTSQQRLGFAFSVTKVQKSFHIRAEQMYNLNQEILISL